VVFDDVSEKTYIFMTNDRNMDERMVACSDGIGDKSIAALAMSCDDMERNDEYDEDREPFIQDAGFHKDPALHLTGDGDSTSLV